MAGDFPNLSSDVISQWPKLNNIDPVTRSWYPAYSITLAVFTTLLLCSRVWSQIRKSTDGFGIDDGLACLAWILATLFTTSCVIGAMKYGFDRHIWDVPRILLGRAALMEWFSEGAYILSTCLTKISVLCFYRRLELPCTTALRRIIYLFISLTAGFSVACLLTQILLCRPTAAYWREPDSTQRVQGFCASQHIYYHLQGSLDVFSTTYTIMIPVLVLRNIPMSKSQRNGLRVVSIVSLSVIGAGITRAIFLSRLVDSANGDATWNGFNVFVWAQLECQLSLVSASLPYLQRYVSWYPSVPIVYVYPDGKERNESVMSRVSSSLSGQIKRFPFGRSHSPRNVDIARPQVVEIPEWEFETLESPRPAHTSVDEISYDRYVQGMYGPLAPPKDCRALFDQYRREHGEIV